MNHERSDLAQYAALDLGSNSFHLVVAQKNDSGIEILGRYRETVRLRAGLDSDGLLSQPMKEKALGVLAQIKTEIQSYEPLVVKAVATSTLRQVSHQKEILNQFEQALGYPIQILTGIEEAEYIYYGVALPFEQPRKILVIDIGGGSTEIACGIGEKISVCTSLEVGCVHLQYEFFKDKKINRESFMELLAKCKQNLNVVESLFQKESWDYVYGSSGTAQSLRAIAEFHKNSPVITREIIDLSIDAVCKCQDVEHLDLPGLPENRKAIFPAGLAIMTAIFDILKLDSIEVCDRALREGLLYRHFFG